MRTPKLLPDVPPDLRFLTIRRHPCWVSASIAEHPRVSGWTKTWRDYRVPNTFLDIAQSDVAHCDDYSLACKLALRRYLMI